MRILGIETKYRTPSGDIRTAAVDWWRTINPLTHLAKNTGWHVDFQKGVIPIENQSVENWKLHASTLERIAKDYNLVHYSYLYNGFGFSALQILERDFGLIHSMDLDDDLLNMSEYNPVYKMFREDPKSLEESKWIINESPRLTVSTPHLQKVLQGYRKKSQDSISVLPNLIDLNVYKLPEKKPHEGIRIVYQGGATHFQDLMMTDFGTALAYILGKYPQVEFRLIGFTPDSAFEKLPRVSYRKGDNDFYRWVEIWKEEMALADIGVAPLASHPFNLAKSNIKWLEYSAAQIPSIVQNIENYKRSITDGKDALLARDGSDWVHALEVLIESQERRKSLGMQGHETVKNEWNIENKWTLYRDYFQKLMV